MLYRELTRSLHKALEETARYNKMLATGKKTDKPSDDVSGTVNAMDYKLSISIREQYKTNITETTVFYKFTSGVLSSLSGSLGSVKSIALSASAGAETPEQRAVYAQEIVQLKDHMLNLGNSKFRNMHIFSGYRTDTPAFDSTTYDYQGDGGIVKVPIENGVTIDKNFAGSSVFSVALSAPEVLRLGDGRYVHYTPGAGTTTNVEIRDTDNITVLDSFSYSNVIQVADLMSSALNAGDVGRINALINPLEKAQNRVLETEAETGARMARLADQSKWIDQNNLNMKNILSLTEDADLTEAIVEIKKAETSLLALRESSARVMSQSLLDFLK